MYDIAMGCVSYMLSSLSLVDPSNEYVNRIKDIAQGAHGLHRYATAKWVHHLDELCKICNEPVDLPDARLSDNAKMLCEKHDKLLLEVRPREIGIRLHVVDEQKLVAFKDVRELQHLAGYARQHMRDVGDVVCVQSDSMSNPITSSLDNLYRLLC